MSGWRARERALPLNVKPGVQGLFYSHVLTGRRSVMDKSEENKDQRTIECKRRRSLWPQTAWMRLPRLQPSLVLRPRVAG